MRVSHHCGKWEGTITYKAWVDNDAQEQEMWEYEVSGAPQDNVVLHNEPRFDKPGFRWHPLLWEWEIVEVLDGKDG